MKNLLRRKKKKKVGQFQRLKRFLGEETLSFFFFFCFLPAIHHDFPLGEHKLNIFQTVGDFVELSSKQLIKLLKVEISHLLKSSSFMMIYLCDSMIRWISVSMQVPKDRFISHKLEIVFQSSSLISLFMVIQPLWSYSQLRIHCDQI